MLIALWIVNVLLAAAFLASGVMKIVRRREALVKSGMAWAEPMQGSAVKLIGVIEVVGAAGLILPIATGIVPILSPIAALGLLLVMIGAVIVHVRRHERPIPAGVLGVVSILSAVLGFLAIR